MTFYKTAFFLFMSFALFGCGGDVSTPLVDNAPVVQQGTFIDSPVANLRFSTATQAGKTDTQGMFLYLDGEMVSFYLGDIFLGEGLAKPVMSPLDLIVNAVGVDDPAVINICRFLQTLDEDGNPENGIEISDTVVAATTGMSVDFARSNTEFGNDQELLANIVILTSLTQAGQRPLVSADQALAHFRWSLGINGDLVGVSNNCTEGDQASSTAVVTVTSAGRVWMDRNLGASQVATSSTDSAAYGDLYQYGRGTDGHQVRTSCTTLELSSSETPGHGNFIIPAYSPYPYDWKSSSSENDFLWNDVSGTNNPCPSGFRVPFWQEWGDEVASWSSNDAAGAFASPLKLVFGGYRYFLDGGLIGVGGLGVYWVASGGDLADVLRFDSERAKTSVPFYRPHGASVRCIQD